MLSFISLPKLVLLWPLIGSCVLLTCLHFFFEQFLLECYGLPPSTMCSRCGFICPNETRGFLQVSRWEPLDFAVSQMHHIPTLEILV